MHLEGIESSRTSGIPREDRAPALAPPLPSQSKSALRGASRHPDHEATREEVHNPRKGGMGEDDGNVTAVVHNATRDKDSRLMSKPHGIHGLGSALFSLVAGALLSTLSTLGAANGRAHDNSSFDEGLRVDPGTVAADAQVGDESVMKEDTWKAAVSVIGTEYATDMDVYTASWLSPENADRASRLEELSYEDAPDIESYASYTTSWASTENADRESGLEEELGYEDAPDMDFYTTSWASTVNVDSAYEHADRAVIPEPNEVGPIVSRALRDLRTSHPSGEARERMTNHLDIPPTRWRVPGNAERRGLVPSEIQVCRPSLVQEPSHT